MKKFKVLIVLIAIVCVAVGSLFVVKAVKAHAFTSNKEEMITNEYIFEEDFNNFDIDIATADIIFVFTEDTKTTVTCVEKEKDYHIVKLEDDTLKITNVREYKWYENVFNWSFESEKVTISLPKRNFNNLKLNVSTGDIDVSGFYFNDASVKASTGDIKLTGIKTNSLDVEASTGNVLLENSNLDSDVDVKVSTGNVNFSNFTCKKLNVKTSTGSVYFNLVDAETIKVKTSTGDVKGSLLTGKSFETKSSTGDIKVPNTTGGSCIIETSTGDIYITVAE